MTAHHHGGGGGTALAEGHARIALVGSPNSGKTTLFNGLTGLRAKTGNYPGVTVARYEGLAGTPGDDVVIEDLPGTYSLDPISPDETIVTEVLDAAAEHVATPDGLLCLMDATALRRSLGLFAHVVNAGLPVLVVLTFADDLARRQGQLDVSALQRALGVPVLEVTGGHRDQLAALRERLGDPRAWERPVVAPPTDPVQLDSWVTSVLQGAGYRVPDADRRTQRIDAVLLHPVWGTVVFFATMFAFFQVIFTLAAPLQGYVESLFAWLGTLASEHLHGWLGSFVGGALLGGVGGVLVFLPQIMLLFVLISLLEASGYLSRAAFLMDRLMSRADLEGRAFVALLSSWACAIPGIMATRSLPSARDRLATMLAAPLMTCSARLPVYILLIGLLVSPEDRWGPVGAQGAVMFVLYLGGACSAMATAWLFKRVTGRHGQTMPFYMEMPTYKIPRARTVLTAVWESARAFVSKVGRIILVTTVLLWLLLNLPAQSAGTMRAHGVDPGDRTAASAYTLDHSFAATVGHAVEPVFAPLGFDWRIDIGVLSSLSARETFVATLGQVAAAENPDQPTQALRQMTVDDGHGGATALFGPATVIALLVFFLYALQCMSTIGVMRRESGSWRWPGIAFGYMFVLAWTMAFLAHSVVAALT